jgi:hypothetical protein
MPGGFLLRTQRGDAQGDDRAAVIDGSEPANDGAGLHSGR